MNFLVSFADSRIYRSLNRLSKQAKKLKFFDKFYLYNENNLTDKFRTYYKDKLILGSKGYGFWCWKPEIILNILNKINDEDCLLYIDAGCHLNKYGKKRLINYFDILKKQKNGVLAFQAIEPNENNSLLKHDGRKLRDARNYKWIKGDILDYFCVRNNYEITNAQQIAGGVFLIKKCKQSIKIINEWRKIIRDRSDLINDDESKTQNLDGFIENRHDQAIWTLICLKYNVKRLSAYEFWYPKKDTKKLSPDWKALYNFPIHAKRDKDLGIYFHFLKKLGRKKYQIKNAISKTGIIPKPKKFDHY